MADTAGLDAPKWTASQNQPDVTHNTALDVIDASVAGNNVVDFASDADYTLDITGAKPQEWQHAVIEMTDTGVVLTGAVNVIVPAQARMYNFFNNTAQILTFKTVAGTGIAIGVGNRATVQNDGTNVVRWTADI